MLFFKHYQKKKQKKTENSIMEGNNKFELKPNILLQREKTSR